MVPVSGQESLLLELLYKLYVVFPNVRISSSDVRPLDQKVVKALDSDLKHHLDNPRATPTDLANLSVDPDNSTLLSMSTNVGVAVNLQNQYTVTALAFQAWDAFFVEVAAVLN